MASSGAWPQGGRRLRRRPQVFTALVCGLLAVAAAGCADLPASGKPRALEANSGQAPGFVQPLPPPGPKANWSPTDVLEGFLHASASFELDREAARLYLAPNVNWQPKVVIVVGAITEVSINPTIEFAKTGAPKAESFIVTATQLATLTPSGQYINSSGTIGTYRFTLAKYEGIWRIQSIQQTSPKGAGSASSLLLLDQADFQKVFQPRNLYFFLPTNSAVLVPDPVFAPIQGSAVGVAQRLVQGLIKGAQNAPTESWLSGETWTALPEGTKLLSVTINSSLTATVNLGGTAATEPPSLQQQMYEQIYKTLTTSPKLAASVQLEFDSQPFQSNPVPSSIIPGVGTSDEPLYFAGNGHGVVYVKVQGKTPAEVAGPAQFSANAGITAIAASDQQGATSQLAVATSLGQGCSVALGTTPASSRKFKTWVLSGHGGPCTTMSWASNGDLWAAAGSQIWVVPAGKKPQSVSLPDGISGSSPSVLALKVAPDSTRVALLVHTVTKGGAEANSLYLAAVSYGSSVTFGPPDPLDPIGQGGASQIGDPEALSWYSPTSLAVVNGPKSAPNLYEVPLTGAQGQLIGSVPQGTNTISANGSSVVLGNSAAGTFISVSLQNDQNSRISHGIWPAYAG